MAYLFNQIMSGITLGCSYALVGAGMSLIWGTLQMVMEVNYGSFIKKRTIR